MKMPTVDGIESDGLVVLAFVKLTPWADNFPSAEVGWFFTHSAMSSACIPSMLITSTRRILWSSP